MVNAIRTSGSAPAAARSGVGEVGHAAGVETLGDVRGEIGLAAALVGERQRLDDEPTGHLLRQRRHGCVIEAAIGSRGKSWSR